MLDTGELQVRSEPVAISQMFDQLRREFTGPAQRQNVELTFSNTSVILKTDEALLTRLTMNLLSNAIRYSPGGRVLVGVRRTPQGPAIEVLDNGVGIAREEQSRIFEEFVRLDNPDNVAAAQGLGLGLSIVSRTAELLGAKVTIYSEPGRGSRFRVAPFERSTRPAENTSIDNTIAPQGDLLAAARVLVIDDDKQSRDSMQALLESWHCIVSSEENPAAVTQSHWDVVVCDYELGNDRFGDAEVRKLQKRQPGLPGILVTGSTSKEVQTRAQAAHLPLLRKPVRPAQLRSALLHVLVQTEHDSQ